MTIPEPNIAAKWLYTTLAADATLAALVGTRIYEDIGPEGAGYPRIVFQMQSPGSDTLGVGARRVWTPLLYIVRGIVQDDRYTSDLETIATRIDALLHDRQVEVTNGRIKSYRERPFRRPERTDETEYRHLGGEYRLLTQAI